MRRRSRPGLVLAGIVLSVALVACGSEDGDSGDGGGSAGASTDPAELVGPTWTLDEATRGAMAQDADQVDADVTLQFAEDGTVSGSSACNTYSGPYEAQDDGSITLGPLASTQMACDEAIMALEANYLQTLDQASSFAIAEGQLILQAMNVQLAYDA